MAADAPHTTETNLGTAKNPVYNPLTIMWAVLLGLPGALFLTLLFKLNG